MLLVALAFTWLPCWVLLARLIPAGGAGHRSILAGYSLLAGLVFIPLLMRLLSGVGIGLDFTNICLAAGALLLAALALPRAVAAAIPGARHEESTTWQKVLIALCLAMIAARVITLGMEVSLRPIFAWDGKQHWAKQARVFFDAGAIVPYVSMQEWLAQGGRGVFTTVHPDYPITIPLLQVWANLAVGEWHHSLMNLPWLLCYVAIGCVAFGQLRAAGANTVTAIAASYMLLSMPFLNIQVALAGYADIFMAACYLAALAAFYNWSVDRQRWQGLLALGFALAGLLIKNEGFYWLLSFIPGLVLVMLPARTAAVTLGGLALAALVLYGLVPHDLAIAGHSIDSIQAGYHPESWQPILLSAWVQDNWHLLGYLFAIFLLAALCCARRQLAALVPVLATLFTALVMYLMLYLFTSHYVGAINYTSLNRVALQLTPALGFVAVLLYMALIAGRGQPPE
jgi:hypothetical protein